MQVYNESEKFAEIRETALKKYYPIIKQSTGVHMLDKFKETTYTNLLALFNEAFDRIKLQDEIYSSFKKVFYSLLLSYKDIVLHYRDAMRLIEAALEDLMLFYKFLSQDEQLAYYILKDSKEYQSRLLNSLQEANKQIEHIIFDIGNIITKIISHEASVYLCKIEKFMEKMHFCFVEIMNFMDICVENSMRTLLNIVVGRMNSKTVKETHMKTWKCSTTKKCFTKHFSNIVVLNLLCSDITAVVEDLRDNFRCMMHNI